MHPEPTSNQIAAAQAYEELFVPSLFGPWAKDVAGSADLKTGKTVLDVGCGTGVLARAALHLVGPEGDVTGLDPDPGMLAVAHQIEPSIRWLGGSAEDLPFPRDGFDAVVSQFSLMFTTDREQAAREMIRVLKPEGRLALAVWDRIESNGAYRREAELLERIVGPEAAHAIRLPYIPGDAEELANLFGQFEGVRVRVETRTATASFPGPQSMVEADLRGWLPHLGIEVDEDRIAAVLAEVGEALDEWTTTNGHVEFETSAHVLEAVKT